MQKEDSSIQNFDSQTLKRNLYNLMSDNDLNQTEFGRIAGINAQSGVSDKLSLENNHNITVEQLANIALHFNVSTDDLLGISPSKKSDEDITLTDIFQRLFEIDDMIGLKIVQSHEHYPEVPEAYFFEYWMCFNNDNLNKKLVEWYSLKHIEANDETKNRLLNVWKSDVLEKGISCKKSENFFEELPFT